MSHREPDKHKAAGPCTCRKQSCAECAHNGKRTCRRCLRIFVYRVGGAGDVGLCSETCRPHNLTLDRLEARLRKAEKRFVALMTDNVHVATVWAED